MVIICQRYCKT